MIARRISVRRATPAQRLRGSASVEFALTATAFLMMVFAVVEFGRLSWTLNAANEATRVGARLAAVCDENDPAVRQRMRAILPLLADENIAIAYPAPNCKPTDCEPVTVSLQDFRFESFIPLIPVSIGMPSFRTSLTRESLDSASNASCQ